MAISSRTDQGDSGPRSAAQFSVAAGWTNGTVSHDEAKTTRQLLRGRYELGEILGHGVHGTTYRGTDHKTMQPVAITVVSERYASDIAFRQRFVAVIAAAERLTHPNIVAILDSGSLSGRPFVVTELVEGQSLRTLFSSGLKLPTDRCVTIALQLADAVACAHREGILHGDLRAENVLIDARGDVKVADFGLVRATAAADERADLHALGLLVYELLTGTTPLPRAAAVGDPASRRQIATPPRQIRPDVPIALDRAVMRSLSTDPHCCFNSVAEFRQALPDPPPSARPLAGQEIDPGPVERASPLIWPTDARPPTRAGSAGFGHYAATIVPFLASLAIVAAALMAFIVVFPRLFSNYQMIDAPNVLDHDLGEASAIAAAHGLTLDLAVSQPTDDLPKDTVLAQEPAPGRRIRRGGELKVTVSAGVRPPNVIGKSFEEARQILWRAGWKLAGVEIVSDAGAPAGTVIRSRPSSDEIAEDRRRGMTLLVTGRNLALRQPIRLDSGASGPAEMVDGDPNTVASLGGAAPRWVEIALPQPSTIAGVELVTAQDQPGLTIHEVWVWAANGDFYSVHTFLGPTEDNMNLSIRFDQPAAEVRAVRIATTQAPGVPGWREIRIFEG
jgi:eukaryotic-like serine/threonine-protein kinase